MRLLALLMIGLGLGLPPAAALAAGGDDTGLILGLKEKPVFVDEGAPGATPDTAGEILELLKSGDGIVILMLQDNGNNTAETVAADVNQRLGGNRIVGVTVGEQAAGHSTILPAGVASDLMKRASTVSVSPAETLRTFILNVHDWQARHPKAPAAKPMEDGGGNRAVLFFVIGSLVLGVTLVIIVILGLVATTEKEDTVRLKKSPDRVRDQLHKLLEVRKQIKDPTLRATLTQIASDVEAYFRRTKDAARLDQDAFAKHLDSLNDVLVKYVDVQDNPRFFDHPEDLLQSGSEAATSFAYFVLETVRREGRRSITDFRVDTNILSAQRYR